MNLLKKKNGFTLIEILVAMGIFAIAMMIVSVIFLNLSNLQRNLNSVQQLQNDGRFMLEKIAKEVRMRELDYEMTEPDPLTGLTDKLIFKPDDTDAVLSIIKAGENLSFDLDGVSGNINSHNVAVDDIKFIITPATDPNLPGSDRFQPKVTVLLTISNRQGQVAEQYIKQLTIQTTISSKIY